MKMLKLSFIQIISLFALSFVLCSVLPPRQTSHVQWTFTANKITNRIYDIHVTATIDKGWHIYSQSQPKDAIAVPMLIMVVQNKYVTHVGGFKEIGNKIHYHDPILDIYDYRYEDVVDFTKKVVLNADIKTELEGTVLYQVCNDEMCYNPIPIEFKIKLN